MLYFIKIIDLSAPLTSLLLPDVSLLKVLAWHGKSVTVCGILMTYAL